MPKLMQTIRNAMRLRGMSYRTEQSYCDWIYRYIVYHGKRHPKEMGEREVQEFLTYLAAERNVARSTQHQALQALLFLYRHVLEAPLPMLSFSLAPRRRRIPVVLSREETAAVLRQLHGIASLQASLLYGCGLRLAECMQLRVKDVDVPQRLLPVRDGKGGKDRILPLPKCLCAPLIDHLATLRSLFDSFGPSFCGVSLPDALARKYPAAPTEWPWFFLFPSDHPSHDPRSGAFKLHHRHESTLQRAIRQAVRSAGITKPVSCHTLRHCYATHMLQNGCDIRTLQTLLGHSNVRTTMIYTHVLEQLKPTVESPLDRLAITASE